MKSLIYDTETTGLPLWGEPSEHPGQPRITQICAELVEDGTGEVYASFNTLIRPDGWTIPAELETLTGITTAKALAVGVSMDEVLPVLIGMWARSDHRVAHNESFDMRMVRIELMRHARYMPIGPDSVLMADTWKGSPAFCTQANSIKAVNAPPTAKMVASGRKGPKPPTLAEAYRHFTGKDLEGAHNAAVDVMACKAVYFGIRAAA